MQPWRANFINGVILAVMGLWAGLSSPSPTAFIPLVFGIIFLICTPFMRKGNKIVAHIVVLVTLLAIMGFAKPLMGAIDRGSTIGIIRLSVMIFSCVVALVVFIKSFIDARKAR